jgi:hypothetical protein
VEDNWCWNPGGTNGFSVKSTYVYLDHNLSTHAPLSSLESYVLKFISKCGVPSKVSALAWQLLLERIPTRDNLYRRGVIGLEDSRCPCCDEVVESARHLFLHCRHTTMVWYAIMRWFGVTSVLPAAVPMSFAVLVGYGSNKRRRKGLAIVWLAFVWVVWKTRNNKVFDNAMVEVPVMVDLVKRLSWQWFLNNTAKGPCLLYEWEWNPGDCMLR